MLLRSCLIYIIIILLRHILHSMPLIPSISSPMSIYDVFMLCILLFHLHFSFHLSNTLIKTNKLIFVNFKKYLLLFLDDNVEEEIEKCWNRNISALEFCLAFSFHLFCQFEPGVALKSVAYKKIVYLWRNQLRLQTKKVHTNQMKPSWRNFDFIMDGNEFLKPSRASMMKYIFAKKVYCSTSLIIWQFGKLLCTSSNKSSIVLCSF